MGVRHLGRGRDSTRRACPTGDRRDDGVKRSNRDDRRPERGAGAGDNRRPDDRRPERRAGAGDNRRPDDRRPERRAGGDKPWGRDERPSDDRRGGGRDKGLGVTVVAPRAAARMSVAVTAAVTAAVTVGARLPTGTVGGGVRQQRASWRQQACPRARACRSRASTRCHRQGARPLGAPAGAHLSKENAEGVAQHLVMAAALLEAEDFDGAEAHAETAVGGPDASPLHARRSGSSPTARVSGRALSEFRTARRLSGSSHMLPLMVDCERGLGRPERALDLATSPEGRGLSLEDRIEPRLSSRGSGATSASPMPPCWPCRSRRLRSSARKPWSPRLAYAYAEALLETGDEAGAREWFARAADFDDDLETDAAERLAEIDGIVMTDLLEGEPDEGGSAEDLQVDRGTRGQGRSADATAGDPARGEDGQRG